MEGRQEERGEGRGWEGGREGVEGVRGGREGGEGGRGEGGRGGREVKSYIAIYSPDILCHQPQAKPSSKTLTHRLQL